MKRIMCALIVVAHLAGCTTLSSVPYGEGAVGTGQSGAIAPGDGLRVTFREGGEKWIKVTRVNADEICAADGCIRASEVASLERREVNVGAVVVLVVLGVALLAALISAMGSMGVVAYGAAAP